MMFNRFNILHCCYVTTYVFHVSTTKINICRRHEDVIFNILQKNTSFTILLISQPFYMDDSKNTIRDPKIWVDGMENIFINMLYQDTLNDKLRTRKITNIKHLEQAQRLTAVGGKVFNANPGQDPPVEEPTTSVYRSFEPNCDGLRSPTLRLYWQAMSARKMP